MSTVFEYSIESPRGFAVFAVGLISDSTLLGLYLHQILMPVDQSGSAEKMAKRRTRSKRSYSVSSDVFLADQETVLTLCSSP